MTDYNYYQRKIDRVKESQESAIQRIAKGSAAAATVPVPGLDISVDIVSMIGFAQTCLSEFGLTEETLNKASEYIAQTAMKKKSGSQAAKQTAKEALERTIVKEAVDKAIAIAKRRVFKFLEKAGIMELVKKFAAQKPGGTSAKFVALPGIAKSSNLASRCTQKVLNDILEEMYSTAKEIYLE